MSTPGSARPIQLDARTPDFLRNADTFYRFGDVQKAALAGNSDAFDTAVRNLKMDKEFRKSNPARAIIADVLVATQLPKMLMKMRRARSPSSTDSPTALSPEEEHTCGGDDMHE